MFSCLIFHYLFKHFKKLKRINKEKAITEASVEEEITTKTND